MLCWHSIKGGSKRTLQPGSSQGVDSKAALFHFPISCFYEELKNPFVLSLFALLSPVTLISPLSPCTHTRGRGDVFIPDARSCNFHPRPGDSLPPYVGVNAGRSGSGLVSKGTRPRPSNSNINSRSCHQSHHRASLEARRAPDKRTFPTVFQLTRCGRSKGTGGGRRKRGDVPLQKRWGPHFFENIPRVM